MSCKEEKTCKNCATYDGPQGGYGVDCRIFVFLLPLLKQMDWTEEDFGCIHFKEKELSNGKHK